MPALPPFCLADSPTLPFSPSSPLLSGALSFSESLPMAVGATLTVVLFRPALLFGGMFTFLSVSGLYKYRRPFGDAVYSIRRYRDFETGKKNVDVDWFFERDDASFRRKYEDNRKSDMVDGSKR
jgi:hypothetical protein